MKSALEKSTLKKLFQDYPDLLDVKQMSQLLGISSKTGYVILQNGEINAIKVGRAYKIPKVNVIKYLKL